MKNDSGFITLEELYDRCYSYVMSKQSKEIEVASKTLEDNVGFFLEGDDIYKMSINLSKTKMFSEVESIEVLNFPSEAVTVKYGHNIKLNKNVKIYSIWFTPAFYREELDPLKQGIYILPEKVDEFRFSKIRQIMTNIDVDRLNELKQLSSEDLHIFIDENVELFRDLFKKVISGKASRTVPVYGNIIIRMTKDSYSEVEATVLKTQQKDSYIRFEP